MDRLKNPDAIIKLADELNAPHIGHEFILTDNLDRSCQLAGADDTFYRNPLKLTGGTFILCLRGQLTFRGNLSSYTIKANEILAINPGAIMEMIDVGSDTRMLSISWAHDYVTSGVAQKFIRDIRLVKVPASEMEECMAIYRFMKSRLATASTSVAAKQIAKGYMDVLCCILSTCHDARADECADTTSATSRLYHKFLLRLQEEYHLHRSVKYYADVLCVTPKYLSMSVKKESGRNASDIIAEMVMLEARARLKSNSHSVQQVAEILNFPNQSFFAKYFRQHCGMTPSAYQKS